MAQDSKEIPLSFFERLKLKQECRLKILQSSSESLNIRPRNFATLHTDILHRIFKNLDLNYVTQHLSLVCRHWRRAVRHKEFIKHLYMRRAETEIHYIFDHMRRFQLLTSLHLENVPNPRPILKQAQKSIHNLHRLALTHYRYLDGRLIEYALQVFPYLEDINLESSTIEYDTDISLLLSHISNLRAINLSDIKMRYMSVQTILQIVLNCRQLEKLDIGLLPAMVQLIDDDVCLLIDHLAQRLKYLALDCRSLTNRSFERLKECTHLEALYVRYAINFTGDLFVRFWSSITDKVREVGFTHNCIITGQDVVQLINICSDGFAKLTHLDFTYCPLINDIAVGKIAKHCPNLRNLQLKSCRSITCIDPVCKKCKELRYLNVAYCQQLKNPEVLPKTIQTLVIDEKSKLRPNAAKFLMRYVTLKVLIMQSEFSHDMRRL